MNYETIRQAALKKDSFAQNCLGILHYFGQSGLPQDVDKAKSWWSKAAKSGSADAKVNLGRLYFEGGDIKVNHAKALQYFKEAVDEGHPEGLYYYALMKMNGLNTDKNEEYAKELVHRAADRGYTPAIRYLANCYQYATGTRQNLVLSHAWYTVAKLLKDPLTKDELVILEKSLTTTQIRTAKKIAGNKAQKIIARKKRAYERISSAT